MRDKAVTFDDVRKISLVWPEVEDGISYGAPALKVRKKLLVRLKEDGDSLVMPGVPNAPSSNRCCAGSGGRWPRKRRSGRLRNRRLGTPCAPRR